MSLSDKAFHQRFSRRHIKAITTEKPSIFALAIEDERQLLFVAKPKTVPLKPITLATPRGVNKHLVQAKSQPLGTAPKLAAGRVLVEDDVIVFEICLKKKGANASLAKRAMRALRKDLGLRNYVVREEGDARVTTSVVSESVNEGIVEAERGFLASQNEITPTAAAGFSSQLPSIKTWILTAIDNCIEFHESEYANITTHEVLGSPNGSVKDNWANELVEWSLSGCFASQLTEWVTYLDRGGDPDAILDSMVDYLRSDQGWTAFREQVRERWMEDYVNVRAPTEEEVEAGVEVATEYSAIMDSMDRQLIRRALSGIEQHMPNCRPLSEEISARTEALAQAEQDPSQEQVRDVLQAIGGRSADDTTIEILSAFVANEPDWDDADAVTATLNIASPGQDAPAEEVATARLQIDQRIKDLLRDRISEAFPRSEDSKTFWESSDGDATAKRMDRVVAATGLAKAICFEAQGDAENTTLEAPYTPHEGEDVDSFIERMVDELFPQVMIEEDPSCNSILTDVGEAIAEKFQQLAAIRRSTPSENAEFQDEVRNLKLTIASLTASGLLNGGVGLVNFLGIAPKTGGEIAGVGSVIMEGSVDAFVGGATVANIAGSATAGVLSAAMAIRNGRRTHLARKRAGNFRKLAKQAGEGEEQLAAALRYAGKKTARLTRERAFETSCNVVSAGAGATAAVAAASVVGLPLAMLAGLVGLGAMAVGQIGTKGPRLVKWIYKKAKRTHGRGRMKNSQIILAHAVSGSQAAMDCLQSIKAVGEPPAKFTPTQMFTEDVKTQVWSFALKEEEAKQHWAPQMEAAKARVMAETDKKQRKKLDIEYRKLKKRRDTDVSSKWDQACAGAKKANVFCAVRKKCVRSPGSSGNRASIGFLSTTPVCDFAPSGQSCPQIDTIHPTVRILKHPRTRRVPFRLIR